MFRFDCTFSNFTCTKRVQLHTILRPALYNTQHTGKEILTRPTSEYFANDPDCVVLLRLIPIRPQIFVTVHIR